MNYFRYKVMSRSGRVDSGVIQMPYDSVMSVITHLERSGCIVIKATKLNPVLSLVLPLFTEGLFKKKVSKVFLAEFLNNLSVMLRSGLTLTMALKETSSGSDNPSFDSAIDGMILDIEMGATFSETAEKHSNVFPTTVTHLIKIGEETGKMEQMLNDASDHLRRMNQIISDTKQALLYPAFVFTFIGAAMLFWFYYVVPKILELFTEMEIDLPPLTIFILNASSFLQDNIFLLVAGVTLTIFITVTGIQQSKRIKKIFEIILLQLPVLKSIIAASNVAYITEYFSLLLNAGIDIRRALALLTESIDNEVYRAKLAAVQEVLSLGEGVSASFKSARIFPALVIRMISVGEQSGSLPEQLKYISDDYRNKLAVMVSTIGKSIEPLILAFAGLMFAIIIGGLFLPIYDLVSQVGSG